MSSPPDLLWIHDFLVVDGAERSEDAIRRIEKSTSKWVIISRAAGTYLYALTRLEIRQSPSFRAARAAGNAWLDQPFEVTLDLHEEYRSTQAGDEATLPPIDRTWRPDVDDVPSIDRYVLVATDASPLAIGTGPPRWAEAGAPPPELESMPAPELEAVPWPAPAPSGSAAPPESPTAVAEDEGTSPIRYPSIEAEGPLQPGGRVSVTIDLSRAQSAHTQGGPVAVGPQPSTWEMLELTVAVSCPAIEFDHDGRGSVVIRRNRDSDAARIPGRVKPTAGIGTTATVSAAFFDGTRFCGSASRNFAIGSDSRAASTTSDETATRGQVVAEPGAERPDVTVRISRVSGQPTRLDWIVETPRFDGLPPKLRASIDLVQDPAAEAAALFGTVATLPRGQHRARIEGFGGELWARAPQMFREVYWALWDHYKRPLAIQVISDEPHLPWELMRPVRADESEAHAPLLLAHSVARWIERWDGYMRNRLPAGEIRTIAPNYKSASRRLPRAQTEADAIVARFGARRVGGTRQEVTTLLESANPGAVSLLHFAGHGVFATTAATESSIKLEDGELAASEMARPEVRLGRLCRTLVFFNACEAGATGSIFGEVGGWADALLGRQFGGFIAPLWSVDDEDAGVVAAELLDGIVTRHEPIGEVLRAVRAKYGDVSPTFYSYLYYGDVTARIGA
jgi:hypothetical protein